MSSGISSALPRWAAEFTKFATEFVKFCRGKLWALDIIQCNAIWPQCRHISLYLYIYIVPHRNLTDGVKSLNKYHVSASSYQGTSSCCKSAKEVEHRDVPWSNCSKNLLAQRVSNCLINEPRLAQADLILYVSMVHLSSCVGSTEIWSVSIHTPKTYSVYLSCYSTETCKTSLSIKRQTWIQLKGKISLMLPDYVCEVPQYAASGHSLHHCTLSAFDSLAVGYADSSASAP